MYRGSIPRQTHVRKETQTIYDMIEEEPRTRHELVLASDMSPFRVRFALLELYTNEHVWKNRDGIYRTLNK